MNNKKRSNRKKNVSRRNYRKSRNQKRIITRKKLGGEKMFLFVNDAEKGLLLADKNQNEIYKRAIDEFTPRMPIVSTGPVWWFDDEKYYISKEEISFKYGDRVMKYTWGIKSGKHFMLNKDSKKIRFFKNYKFDSVDYDQIKRKNLITTEKRSGSAYEFR